jgi:hypothetical protein
MQAKDAKLDEMALVNLLRQRDETAFAQLIEEYYAFAALLRAGLGRRVAENMTWFTVSSVRTTPSQEAYAQVLCKHVI